MSKIRQALRYEYRLAAAAIAHERKQSIARVEMERALRKQQAQYEGKLTSSKFVEIKSILKDHETFHDREHQLYDDAVDKAASGIRTELSIVQQDLRRWQASGGSFMTVDRFDREHQALVEKVDTALATLAQQIGSEEKVTVGQTAQSQLRSQIGETNRWMVGLALLVLASLIGSLVQIVGLVR